MAKKDDKWIQKATKGMVKTKPCTGKKFGSKTCPPGSKRYNLAKTFKKMGKSRKKAAEGGRIGLSNGGLSHASGYSPVLGNNRFGYPSGGVEVQKSSSGCRSCSTRIRKSFHERWKSLRKINGRNRTYL